MAAVWLSLLLLCVGQTNIIARAAGACVQSGVINEKSVWNQGMSANLNMKFPSAVNSWRVTMTFDRALTNFETWSATPSTSNNVVYTLDNLPYNGNQPAGASLSIAFNAHFASKAEVISVKMNGVEQCRGGVAGAGGAATTTTTTTTTTTPSTGSNNPPSSLPYDYQEVLRKSLLFYEAQRSGRLPSNNRIPWRGDSAMNDRGENGEDLTGGYYDAGDRVKFGLPMAASMTVLAWGAIDFASGYAGAGQSKYVKQAVKWGTDYFIKAHVGSTDFYGQCGNGDTDHAYWGRAEDMTMNRPCYKITASKPGSDLAGETAAALAAASILFKTSNPSYSATCLQHAKQMFQFADRHRGKYQDAIPNAGKFYSSSGYGDELAWAAAWLYRATNDQTYLDKAKGFFQEFSDLSGRPSEFSWDSKHAGVQLLMYQLTGESSYGSMVTQFCDWVKNNAPRSPKGMVYLNQWGSLRHVGNVAFICLVAAKKGLKSNAYENFAIQQLNYILGDGGRSYVVGFGKNPPVRPHHAGASCPDAPAPCGWDQLHTSEPNPHVLYGALVGGPDQYDAYEDKRSDYVKNEVALDYNAGFQSAIAGVLSL
ncbi:Endoglucanase E-4 [Amphibalanus amphitrite]|uniref:Endoglucanase n=1 Tax=Amphibalanus amphitrite TaxID=1232801 RepID=A0A6A4W9D4_AMPAM|nr:endoglucanase 15-like [Amphibalanus amphitrite]KAF0300354.1 Endoglucanase E-4 [Amphibalanus amphitrite]